ncbi:serine protease inhibitor 42Dd [Stomoxys calcitrans]|uniref:serine protease inhibitor 42Dd n=1 Tax=Stomoxys calcitrans TaxID=35570 RepID=UPI0027E31A4B|nr:serine protease inhibitor 42Dd [Stomoxys calcitrans]
MWKIFILAATWTHLVCAQCNFQDCNRGQPLPMPNGQQQKSPIMDYYNTNRPNTLASETHTAQSVHPNAPPSQIYFPNDSYNVRVPSEVFDARLFGLLSGALQDRNFCISPVSMQILLTFLSTVSEGKLFDELSRLLNLANGGHTQVAQIYRMLTQVPRNNDNVSNTLILANKLFYDWRFGETQPNFNNYAHANFATEVNSMDFVNSLAAANIINHWVATKTRNLIKNVVFPNYLSPDTTALLINSLYFKSEWQTKFGTYDTDFHPFHLNNQQQVQVEMMYNEDIFRYGEFEQLGASVLELPYKLEDFSMLIILPNDIEGLAALEKRLSTITIKLIAHRLERREVQVKLPKFSIEFDVDMVQPLQHMGLYSLFNNDSRINIFKDQTQRPLVVNSIKHKTYINVNEIGTEAAAATVAKITPLSIPLQVKSFIADHPFIFVIRNSNAVYFMGHVVKF